MATSETARYQQLLDPRVSMESNEEDESARLIDASSDDPAAAPRNARSIVIVFHPTILFRVLGFIFGLSTFLAFLFSGGNAIPALVFLPLAMARQIMVLCSHYVGKIVEIRIDVTNSAFKRTSFVKKVSGLPKGTLAILVDIFNICALIAVVTVGMLMSDSVAGGVLGYFTIIFLLMAIIDMGSPGTVTATLQKPAGAAWEVSRVGRAQAAGPDDADLAKIFGKQPPQEERETSPVPGPSAESMV